MSDILGAQASLDYGQAVQASQGLLQGIINALTAARSAVVNVVNYTSYTLRPYNRAYWSGGPATVAPGNILPGKTDTFTAQSASMGVMVGSEGMVEYGAWDPNGQPVLGLKVIWRNPYLGGNSANALLGSAQAQNYKVRYITGNGNTGAVFWFFLIPAGQDSDSQQIKDITEGFGFVPLAPS